MRALHLVKTPVGAAWALRQMGRLSALGHEVHVALPADGPLVRQYLAAGIKVHFVDCEIPVHRPWTWPRVQGDLRRLVKSVQPGVIHSHFYSTTIAMRLALRDMSIPRIFQVPGTLHLEHRAFAQLELAIAQPVDRWIGSCRWTCERYKTLGIRPDRVFLSYYGTDVEQLSPAPGDGVRDELGFPADTRLVGMVAYMYAPKLYLGQHRGIKGHEDFIDAIALCRREDPTIRGVCVGGAWGGARVYEQRVQNYAARRAEGGVLMLGTRSDVARLYSALAVAVHPSHSENCGGAVESLMAGVPTIASDVGGLPDVVVPNETGWLVPPRNPRALAKTILEVISDPARARDLAQAGRARTRLMFDVTNTAAQVEAVYAQLGATVH